jgi:hypothetical protein
VGGLDDALQIAYTVASGGEHGLEQRALDEAALDNVVTAVPDLAPAASPEMEAGRRAILDAIRAATSTTLGEALDVQARHSGGFMTGDACRRGVIGTAWKKTVLV